MKFIILNGSPKCEKSVTLQSIKYLSMHNPVHEFDYFHVNREIKKLEQSKSAMESFCKNIREYDGVIWAFPVYCGHVPSGYKRFIELIFEYGLEHCFTNKYATAFSTSIHYFDHTAQNYMHSICDDLNMNYVDYLSHETDDLLREGMRADLRKFFNLFAGCIEDSIKLTKEHRPLSKSDFKYEPALCKSSTFTEKKTFIITDARECDVNVQNMIEKYKDCVNGHVEVFNLNDVDMKGSCIGCCRCGYDNTCVYRDGFKAFYDNIIDSADKTMYENMVSAHEKLVSRGDV